MNDSVSISIPSTAGGEGQRLLDPIESVFLPSAVSSCLGMEMETDAGCQSLTASRLILNQDVY
jgi:hypothetical protein